MKKFILDVKKSFRRREVYVRGKKLYCKVVKSKLFIIELLFLENDSKEEGVASIFFYFLFSCF